MPVRRRVSHALALFLLLALGACAYNPPPGSRSGEFDSADELSATPFYPQQRYQCGPASLVTVLTSSGVDTTLEKLVRQVYLPAREGSLQAEMLAATRAAGRVPYRIDGNLSAISRELSAGRPVLVLQNLGVRWLPRWHYAVVVGLEAGNDRIVLRSGTERRRETRLRTFLHTWKRSGYWGFVVVPPDELPAEVDQDRWFNAVSELEETGPAPAALTAWQHALENWPDAAVALFGLANAHYRMAAWPAAEAGYRRLLRKEPGLAIARNNLALVLMQQGQFAAALAEARRAREDAGRDAALQAEIDRTLKEIRAAQPRSGRPSSTSR